MPDLHFSALNLVADDAASLNRRFRRNAGPVSRKREQAHGMLERGRAESQTATVDFICIDRSHVERGRDIPDTYGALTLNGRQWAYCSAALGNAPHEWKATGG